MLLQLKAVIQETGERVNAGRARRGLEPRAVRACVIGFPNVGKSALINRSVCALKLGTCSARGSNLPASPRSCAHTGLLERRLLGRRMTDSAPKPGVTRQLRWVRVGGNLDMLDAPGKPRSADARLSLSVPALTLQLLLAWRHLARTGKLKHACHQQLAAGVIPAQFRNQLAAQRLAMCNDIGEAAYTTSLIAAALYEHLARLPKVSTHVCSRMPACSPILVQVCLAAAQ